MDGHCLSPYTCKRCITVKQFDGLNFDGLAGKCQKRQNSALRYCKTEWHIFIEKAKSKLDNSINLLSNFHCVLFQ